MKRAALLWLLFALPAFAQTPSPYKNVEYLKNLTPTQLSRTMQMISQSLGTNCGFCHVRKGEEWDFPADDKHEKETARNMIKMTSELNQQYFSGHSVVSCNSCHRGQAHPVNLIALPLPAPTAPPASHDADEKRPPLPSRDDLLAKYSAALGKLDAAKLASLTGKGTREAANGQKAEFTLSQANGAVRVESGDFVTVLTPNGGWASNKGKAHEMSAPEREHAAELNGAMQIVLPSEIPVDARVIRKDKVGDREAYVMQMNVRPGVRQRLYFDAENGLLLRRAVFTSTPIGEIPLQVDYSDWRDAGGFKLPYTVRLDSVDARLGATRRYAEIQTGAKVDAGVFVMPK